MKIKSVKFDRNYRDIVHIEFMHKGKTDKIKITTELIEAEKMIDKAKLTDVLNLNK